MSLATLAAVKPTRRDVPLPPFPPGLTWLRGAEPVSERVTARGPLFVHFFEVGELSSVRTIPFVSSLRERYGSIGLTVLGVHSPRNALAASDSDLDAALDRLGIDFVVANDDEHRIWHSYGCEGWPSSFVWKRGGVLRWAHFGEGAYHETEAELREELAAISDGELPPSVLDAPEGSNGKAPKLARPSEEVFPGGRYDTAWSSAQGEPLVVEYSGAGAWAALGGSGRVEVAVDGDAADPIEVGAPGLYELASHGAHGAHEVEVRPEPSVSVWSFAFPPGLRD